MKAYLLNLKEEPSRLHRSIIELARVEVPYILKQSTRATSVNDNIINVLTEHLNTYPADDCYIIEDDIRFHKYYKQVCNFIDIPLDWELLYAGGAVQIDSANNMIGVENFGWKRLLRVTTCIHGHSLYIRSSVVNDCIDAIKAHPDWCWDISLMREIQRRGKSYLVWPTITRQYDNSRAKYTEWYFRDTTK